MQQALNQVSDINDGSASIATADDYNAVDDDYNADDVASNYRDASAVVSLNLFQVDFTLFCYCCLWWSRIGCCD